MRANRHRQRFLVPLFSVLILGSAPIAAQQPDPQVLLQTLLQNLSAAQQGSQNSMPATLPRLGEKELAARIAAWPEAAQRLVVETRRDGFLVNGQRVVDPEGKIVQHAVDPASGDITYIAETVPNQYVVKTMRFGAGAPLTIASATRGNLIWSVETASGQRLNGRRLIPTARGFIVARENVLFRYEPGAGISNSAAPDEYNLAAFQNGDIGGTGFVLLERRPEVVAEETNSGLSGALGLGRLARGVRSLGAMVGANKGDSDYALFSMTTGKLIPVGITIDDKQANFYSECYRRNAIINQCAQMESREALWQQDGFRNQRHYYWRVFWFATPHGPVAVTMEDSSRTIEAVNLQTDARAVVFERSLGIAGWHAEQGATGELRVTASLGFDKSVREDVAALVGANPPAAVSVTPPRPEAVSQAER